MRSSALRLSILATALATVMVLAVWAVSSFVELAKRAEAARRHADLVKASQYRETWASWTLPSPNTPITIDSPFGHFTIPLANIADRSDFVPRNVLGQPLKHLDPLSDGGVYGARTFTVAFWMPDGAGVLNPAYLPNHTEIDPVDLRLRRTPFRPRETGRPDPSSDRFVVVVGDFCARGGGPLPALPQAEGPHMGVRPNLMGLPTALAFSGYGYGALELFGCRAKQLPPPEWVSVPTNQDLGRTEMFCRPDADMCFGWLDLPDYSVRALTFLPADAVGQVASVAAELRTLLKTWSVPR